MTISEPRQSFGEQAARFSCYVPLAVLLIGCLGRAGANADKDGRSVAVAIFGINMLLIVAGFALGIVALVSMKRFGPERILVRAIIGVVLNGLALLLVGGALMPLMAAGNAKQQVVGTWRLTNSRDANVKRIDITFNKDDSFTFVTTPASGQPVTITGKWVFTPRKQIGLDIEALNGDRGSKMSGQKIGLGNVKKIDAKQMTLGTEKGDEVYQRAP